MYRRAKTEGPKAVGPQIVAILTGLVVGVGVAVGCGDEDEGAAVKGTVPASAQTGGVTYQDAAKLRDAVDSLAGTTDTRPGAGFKLVYSKGKTAD